MMIYLVRHGIAEDLAKTDAARRLTEEGREKAVRVAKAFRKRIPRVETIFHSTFLRAAETAAIFSAEFPKAKLVSASGLTPGDSPTLALPLIQSVSSENAVMIVGHEPHLSSLASILITGQDLPLLEFRKAGIAGIEYFGPASGGRLCFLLSPRWLS